MTIRTVLATALALAAASQASAADISGLWATPKGDGRVEISHCGATLCGRLVSSDTLKADPALKDIENRDPALQGRPLKGLLMLRDFAGGPSQWTGGKVYNPEDGHTYSGSIAVVGPDRLRLRGCVVAPLCRTQVWTRVR